MQRRHFNTAFTLGLGSACLPALAQKDQAASPSGRQDAAWRAIESSVRGRLGVAVIDTGTGRVEGHRSDERFAMCSTFKWLLAALVLQRVDASGERLARRIVIKREALMSYAPVTEKRAGDPNGMSLAELCEAAVTLSDNTAANLLLEANGGRSALTRFTRSLGDTTTRFDRLEPLLNEARPGDPRDTTSPRAMGLALRQAALGNTLSEASRAQLIAWLSASTTGAKRLRAGLPADWRVADKTGTGEHGTTNDVAMVWPPHRAPLVITAFLTECSRPLAEREAALADVARELAKRVLRS